VLVIGAGPIGVLMARAALDHGARRVFSSDPVRARLAFAEAQGATPVAGDDPEAAVRAATGGRGVDVVIDAAGFEQTWGLALRVIRPGGRIEAVGLGQPAGTVDFFAIAGKEVQVTGSFAWTDEDFARALTAIEAGSQDTSGWFTTMPLADGQRAFEELVDTQDRFKVVLRP
jgi:threonine dehydrogenase-like Zn-dependent dehydrogenase